ncbi:MAG: hypothetical protein ACI9Y1_002372 [Lentisphaeria bacterium]
MTRFLIVSTLLFIQLQVSAYAKNLFVDPSGNDSPCSYNRPCSSIQSAIDIAGSGDIININAGRYKENLFIQTAGITLQGENKRRVLITSAGGRDGATGNAGNPLDAIIEVRAGDISIFDLTLFHPRGRATKREAAIFSWQESPRLHVRDTIISRRRNKRVDEPTIPGSRGIFIFSGPGSIIEDNIFTGNYQDHIHLPSKEVTVRNNKITGAARAGISVMDPVSFVGPNFFDSTKNIIVGNLIMNSIDDGIHIQGDQTIIRNNIIVKNQGYGIYLCGEGLGGGCYFPGEEAVSEDNLIKNNLVQNNLAGRLGDFGIGNRF